MTNASRSLNIFFSTKNFVGSFNLVDQVPNKSLPECCFIGRSNVGKSSIINAITRSKKLAKTSKTPGRTQNINLFEIKNKINIVDLPGYGYAKVSKVKRHELSELIKNYLIGRANLVEVFILIDCKIGIKDTDIDFFDILSEYNKKFSIILTKIDKCSLNFVDKQNKSLKSLLKNYKTHFNKIFSSSSNKNIGIIDIQKEIFNLSKLS
jgi:GTP-binding protein|tara:strand:+ start:65 stop:688 length:624 start_codon:yes stop_codon:yes gene_type:complete